jgi:FkbM family methyltransferase
MAGWDANLIFDVGAHKGEDTEFYLRKGFRVVAIEASPRLAASIRDRFSAEVASGQVVVVNAAITEHDGRVPFFDNIRTSVWGTTRVDWAERNSRVGAPSRLIEVDGIALETLLHRHGIPYYLKIDIEGSDLLCLAALQGVAAKPRYVSLESTKTSWNELIAEFDLLQALGYRRYKVVPQHTVEAQRPVAPAREGRYVEHRFAPGASGQFGAEAPGEWVNRARALAIYYPIFMLYALFGHDGLALKDPALKAELARYFPAPEPAAVGWYDTHASLD